VLSVGQKQETPKQSEQFLALLNKPGPTENASTGDPDQTSKFSRDSQKKPFWIEKNVINPHVTTSIIPRKILATRNL
jgi:hypothetical protein